jgi:DNA primase catalytic core
MARIAESELERLKAEVSVARLVEESGIKLEKRGKDLVGPCPFHQDDTPSLIVTPEKNLFHCFGCNAGGGPIDWMMKKNGVSFRHAVELLREGVASVTAGAVKQTRVRALPPPVRFDADDQALLNQVIGYYHETLKQSPEALDYLRSRGLAHPELIDRFKLGYANRTLGLRLPEKTRKAGSEVRTRLEKLGLYRESGHEHFNGSLVVPVVDDAGNVVEVYGRKVGTGLRTGTAKHLYLPGPHKGVWNLPGVAASGGEVILTEALIDAMTFWCAGYRNVTSAYGVNGITADHLASFKAHGVARILIAFDRDEAGERACAELSARLMAEGFACYRIEFPKTLDANAYALKVTPAAKSLGVLIRKALWLGQGRAPRLTSAPGDELQAMLAIPVQSAESAAKEKISLAPTSESKPDDMPSSATTSADVRTSATTSADMRDRAPASSLAAESSSTDAPPQIPEPAASVMPPGPVDDPVLKKTPDELVLMLGDRQYRIRGWMKPLNPESMKVNLLVHRGAGENGRFHVDTFDLYNAKARSGFIKQAGIELGEAEDTLKHDLGRVLLKLEALQDAELALALKKTEHRALSEAERDEALALLKDPGLIDRIRSDFAVCGIVGEETNTVVGYLASVSRLLDKPLAVIIQSSSAAGKSSLMDAVLALVPPEAQVRYSAMTGQSLFYMGETNLKHKILAIAEEEGAESASYALKLLQSEGEVTIASTGKDPDTGLLVTHEYRVEGPVMLFLTTTAIDIDEELLNRCLVLTVNESREQTRAIHALQRKRQTLEGLLAEEEKKAIIRMHRNAQTLLQQLHVVNPYADALTFLDDKTRTRRDHMKYLTLIKAIALLYQHQRTIHSVEHRGQILRYVEVEKSDIALANTLAHEVLGRTLDELPPQTRALLRMIVALVAEQAKAEKIDKSEVRFSRRELRARSGLSHTQLGVHLSRLTALEYLLAHKGGRGQSFVYELIYDGDGGSDDGAHLAGLIDVSALPASTNAKSRGENPSLRGQSGPKTGPFRGDNGTGFIAETIDAARASLTNGANSAKPHNIESAAAVVFPRSDLRPAGGQAPVNGASRAPSSSLAASSSAAKSDLSPDMSTEARRAKVEARSA